MEIINYVQESSYKKRLNLPRLSFMAKNKPTDYQKYERKARKQNNIFKAQDTSFSAKQVKRPVSIHSFFKAIGREITEVQIYVTNNLKKIMIISASVLLVLASLVGAYFITNNVINSTGPLSFKTENSLDIENLNKLMASFALEGTVEYDESGKLLDTENFVPQVFTQPVTYQKYTVKKGDTISGITKKFGLLIYLLLFL